MSSITSISIRHFLRAVFIFFLLLVDASAEPKIEIALFQYKGVIQGQKGEEKFSNFRGILDRKLLNLKNEVLQTQYGKEVTGKDLSYLNKLNIKFRDKDNFSNVDDVYKWMSNEIGVLVILRGNILSDDNSTYNAYTDCYLRNQQHQVQPNILTLSMPIKSVEVANNQDSHTIAFLYALAMDAKSQGRPNDQIVSILRPARDKLADIRRRNRNLSPELIKLESAIINMQNDVLRK